ncbi:hypothetical protein TSOC_008930 [Tetrabaena socialis]|uniref:Uncharacterized protein n=1 Tax=Tetrabaena socialis TaxID=47790 RepID=A0A2J7ZX04_9CHLO|nr:hypothetical protein TSOC_008930 [Tetrabaena socialis]|eukprot:PNH04807.1 hypothetical protein TSOC_008930 [Tetrabaena socialis]
MAFTARRAAGATTSGRTSVRPSPLARGFVTVRAAAAAAPTPCRAAEGLASGPGPAEYAVISIPTGQQLVEEGQWFALSSTAALQASSGSEDGRLRFPAVAVKRVDGEFEKGRPYLANWVVEAEWLIEEQAFEAPRNASGASSRLGKVLVTRISHTEETRRLIEDALRA